MTEPTADALDSSRDETPHDGEDLEAAYRRALEAMETAESAVGQAFEELAELPEAESPTTSPPPSAADPASSPAVNDASSDRPSPVSIVEAALFVGGVSLTTKKLSSLLSGEFDADAIGGFVDRLNERYSREGRPYEITFGEGGYRMQLRSEFEDVRNRVFGLGPRDVKLSQPALEVLSLVAYRQPITREQVEEHGGKTSLTHLRQLVRRQLVEVERTEGDQDVHYSTTARFLEVFGIANLDELPRPGDLEFK